MPATTRVEEARPRRLGGVGRNESGALFVKPQPGPLAEAQLGAVTALGAVNVSFAQAAGVFNLTVALPASARVCLPRAVDATGSDADDVLIVDGAAVDAPEFDGHTLCAPADLAAGGHVLARVAEGR